MEQPRSALQLLAGRFAGTGSSPPRQSGWQRRMRQSPSQAPRQAPCADTASMKYCEQLGWKRQWKGTSGESVRW
jgi:hypothetical protein